MRLYFSLLAAVLALSLGACGTSRNLPTYERPLARTDFQQVRTTAYTDTEVRSPGNTGIAPRWAVSCTRRRRQLCRAPFRSRNDQSRLRGTTISRSPTSRPRSRFWRTIFPTRSTAAPRPIGRAGRRARFFASFRPANFIAWKITVGRFRDETRSISTWRRPREMNGWGVRQELIQIVQWGDPTGIACAGSRRTPNTATSSGWCWNWKANSGPRQIWN